MNNLQRMLSFFGCCAAADDEMTVPCNPTGHCQCKNMLDKIQDWVGNLERRIRYADRDVKACPQYADALVQLGIRQIASRPTIVQFVPAPVECYYADLINELVYRALIVTSKLNRNSEIVRHCLAHALATCQRVFLKEPILIPGVPPAVAKTIRCRCRCMPIVNVLQLYVLNLVKKMDCNDQDLLICLDHTNATYSPNAQAEEREEQAV